jgi:NADH-quinone oxidoreductase subunit C
VPHPATVTLAPAAVAARIRAALPDAVAAVRDGWVELTLPRLSDAMRIIRDDAELDGKFLVQLCSVDAISHIDVVYHFASLAQNHIFEVKVRTDRDNPRVPSITPLWLGANLQEREVYDLMGVVFEGHPELTRIFLWDKFPGHPLRKDFMALPGGLKPGLSQFPKQIPGETGQEFRPQNGS